MILKGFCILTVTAVIPYYFTSIYEFQKDVPFSGDQFYNPYDNLDTLWVKANFHAHSRAWAGLTNGNVPSPGLVQKYLDLNYHLPGISNYNFIEPHPESVDIFIPEYEHGFNTGFIHQLVLNAERSTIFDFPLMQYLSHKQSIINKLKTPENLVALAHPSFKRGYSSNDLTFLSGYDLLEIVSVRAISLHQWDKALSTGHAVWGIANDDAHDTTDFDVGVCWNLINVQFENAASCLESLSEGRSIAVKGWLGQDMHQLRELEVTSDLFTLRLDHQADSILLFSDHGVCVYAVSNSDVLIYRIQPENTYLRAEVFETEPWNEWTRMYLNPVVRHEGISTPANNMMAEVDRLLSGIYWLSLAMFQILAIWFGFFKWRRK